MPAITTWALVAGRIWICGRSTNKLFLTRNEDPLGYWLIVGLLALVSMAAVVELIRRIRAWRNQEGQEDD
jgi:dolichyl-phosphate-mannose--protein O-mannosyl transferase